MTIAGRLFILVFTLWTLTASASAADSPIFEAIHKGDKAAVAALLAKGADVNAKSNNGYTPLQWASDKGADMIELLLDNGADVNVHDPGYKETLLHIHARSGGTAVISLLLKKGADVTARDNLGGTPLHTAAHWGKKDIVELLLAKGADVNAKKADGATPLFEAAETGEKETIALLLARGADLQAKDNFGNTPLQNAAAWGRKDTVALLEEYILKAEKDHPREALVKMTAQIKDNPGGSTSTRRLIIKLASELEPAPEIPEEARKHFIEGTVIVKAAKNPAQQALAAQSFSEALEIAPWWGDAYYNLGVAQELAENYDGAEQAFDFYLLSNPSEDEKRAVQDRIYGLSAKRKLAAQTDGQPFLASLEGAVFECVGDKSSDRYELRGGWLMMRRIKHATGQVLIGFDYHLTGKTTTMVMQTNSGMDRTNTYIDKTLKIVLTPEMVSEWYNNSPTVECPRR